MGKTKPLMEGVRDPSRSDGRGNCDIRSHTRKLREKAERYPTRICKLGRRMGKRKLFGQVRP